MSNRFLKNNHTNYETSNSICKISYFYRNDAFTARTLLAAIDHNAHIDREPLLTKDGVSVVKEGKSTTTGLQLFQKFCT